ncbi:hypothetical protein B0H16DRAFT_1536036 [Mycena metata]|uniref:Uncharacterized protein n=1 Tax=Mycena metata TaxID=1033252 RepID=A0AAD7J6U5_9AGAR|nr:hypothetical protein B0H16DRAFT_1536036 [Mycena metata]
MRFFFSLLFLFALLFTFATATSTKDDTDSRVAMDLLRPWTWSLTFPAFGLPAQPDAAALHVRRHGPRRRAMHP